MSLKKTIIKGTFWLTAAGMLSRLIGFYYRIFLTHTIGAEGVGIYQLIFPVYVLCLSICSSGIQTTVSRLVAAENTHNSNKEQLKILKVGLTLSLLLSIISAYFVYQHSSWIANNFLHDYRCVPLLKILAFAIPLASIHSLICGYYYGIQKVGLPSVAQLFEQVVRVAGVYFIARICTVNQQFITIDIAVFGLVIGEIASTLLSITALSCHCQRKKRTSSFKALTSASQKTLLSPNTTSSTYSKILCKILKQATPLSANRLLVTVLQSIESILIPFSLQKYGADTSTALSTYGILTGMALPLILFPSALTNSVSVLLMPAIAQAQAQKNTASIKNAVETSLKYCLLLGIYCTGIFLYLGRHMGGLLFHSEEAGKFIVTLAWLCPFLYITTTLGSIVHGLGKTFLYLIYNCISLSIRIGFVVVAIPKLGIIGYLWGLLASQLILTALLLFTLIKEYHYETKLFSQLVLPCIFLALSLTICKLAEPFFNIITIPILSLGAQIGLISLLYGSLTLYSGIIKPHHLLP